MAIDLDDEGWIKLHRKLLKSGVFTNAFLLKVFIWCLLRASHEEEWVSIKTGRSTTEVQVKPGQFIFGRKQAAKKLKMKQSTVYDRVKKLTNMQILDIKPNTHYTMISVINWHPYQNRKTKPDSKSDNHPTTIRQPSDTYKKDKKTKNKEKLPKKEPFGLPNIDEIEDLAAPKLKSDLDNICKELYDKKIFTKVHAFKNAMLKKGRNERTIFHALSRCYLKNTLKPFKNDSEAWAYCLKIIQAEDGNYNEKDHNKTN